VAAANAVLPIVELTDDTGLASICGQGEGAASLNSGSRYAEAEGQSGECVFHDE
jgi:hypothetical protein